MRQDPDGSRLVPDPRLGAGWGHVTEAEAKRISRSKARWRHPDACKLFCRCGRVLGELIGKGEILSRVTGRGGDNNPRHGPQGAGDPARMPSAAKPSGDAASIERLIEVSAWGMSRMVFECRNPRCRESTITLRRDKLADAFARAQRSGRVEVRYPEDL